MNPLKLKERITIKVRSTSEDSWGQETGSATDLVTKWAEVKQLSGSSLEAARQLYPSVQYEVTTRYDDSLSLSEENWISWGSKTLDIGSVENVNQANRWWVMLCSEVR